ncbi:MAG: NADP oxidoreductase [Flavobacteriales bacterium]|nr:NADP oxidoreductase [Flavobacteriales bacterium]|tara:strand:- start:4577 stop:5332 length:756 start_codon:yes stop_codon:yes gene_type:complete
MKDIILIGSGNVATHLGNSLKKRGFNIVQVWSKHINNAKILANRLDCESTSSIKQLKKADLYILAVKDDAINQIISQLKDITIVHTSGSIDIEVFNHRVSNYGVFYPLQTFNKNVDLDLSKTPICIEANNKKFENKLMNIARELSRNVIQLDSESRRALHIAAVFACNFSNHMYTISEKILSESNLDFRLLLPLINQTVTKLKDHNPSEIQTGPAKRNDKQLIDSHIIGIKDAKFKELYTLISNSIISHNE